MWSAADYTMQGALGRVITEEKGTLFAKSLRQAVTYGAGRSHPGSTETDERPRIPPPEATASSP